MLNSSNNNTENTEEIEEGSRSILLAIAAQLTKGTDLVLYKMKGISYRPKNLHFIHIA